MSDNESDSNRRKRSSLVWQYFEKLSDSRVKCRICRHEQRYMGNTANALRHLKVKHDIDARACGLSDPENVRKMKALSVSASHLEKTIAVIQKGQQFENNYSNKQVNDNGQNELPEIKEKLFCHNRQSGEAAIHTVDEIDPYNSGSELYLDLEGKEAYFSEEHSKDRLDIEHQPDRPASNTNMLSATKRRILLEERRIIAETNYYREKAEYFRIQKHLAFLQAKKIKYELEQLYGK